MTTPKLRESDIERLKQEAEKELEKTICSYYDMKRYFPNYFMPDESLREKIETMLREKDDDEWSLTFWTKLKKVLREIITSKNLISRFEEHSKGLEHFFEGYQSGSSPQAQQALKNVRYYNDLTIQSFEYFNNHLNNNDNFFSANIYRQWLEALKLGFYTAPEFIVLGRYGLNYSDQNNPSPRLEKLKSYLFHVYRCRLLVEIFDSQLTSLSGNGGNSFSMSSQSWNEYLGDVRKQLNNSFSPERSQQLFREIFGSDNPSAPPNAQLFQAYQQQALDRIALALLPEQQRNQSQSSGMNRDYVAETQASQSRQHEERQRRERERQEQETNQNSPSNQSEQSERGRTRSPSPPRQTGFNNSQLNDIINKMNDALSEDSQAQGHNQGQSGFGLGSGNGYSFDGSLNSIMKEDTQKLPWLVMGYNLDQSGRWDAGLITGVNSYPFWKVYDPATAATFRHYQGDCVTLLCELCRVEHSENFSNVLHNFFWAKNTDKKGFQRLEKDEEIENKQLLITGKRADDKRADKLGWSSWNINKSNEITIGVPNVKQESNAVARNLRNQDNAYDLNDTNNFIGVLRSKGILGKFSRAKRRGNWGSAPKTSILWITNQLSYPRKKNMDWLGDDISTINSNNGFTHYLIFSDYTTEEINEKFIQNNSCKNLAELVSKLNGVLVRLGPDALELMDAQTKQQKERSESETKESREKNKQEITEQNLQDIGLTKEDWEALTTAFTDPAKIDNIIKKLANCPNTQKLAELLDKMFDHLQPETREKMFNQMIDNNPVFTEKEREELKKGYQELRSEYAKKTRWKRLTSGWEQQLAHSRKDAKEKDQIFKDQVNQNPRYGPAGVDTQERRNRLNEYQSSNNREQLQKEENERFTTGENANQWGNYFQDNANRVCGAGDQSVGTESDNNFNGQFSFKDSLNAINKLKNIGSMKPHGMEEGMISNKPYWGVVMNHPLTYIFLFIGIIVSIMSASTKKR